MKPPPTNFAPPIVMDLRPKPRFPHEEPARMKPRELCEVLANLPVGRPAVTEAEHDAAARWQQAISALLTLLAEREAR